MYTLIQITMFAIAFVVTDKILKSRGIREWKLKTMTFK